jgi:hypothetical protein
VKERKTGRETLLTFVICGRGKSRGKRVCVHSAEMGDQVSACLSDRPRAGAGRSRRYPRADRRLRWGSIRGLAAEKQKSLAGDGLEGKHTGATVATELWAREVPRNWTTGKEVAQGLSSAVSEVAGVNVDAVVA